MKISFAHSSFLALYNGEGMPARGTIPPPHRAACKKSNQCRYDEKWLLPATSLQRVLSSFLVSNQHFY